MQAPLGSDHADKALEAAHLLVVRRRYREAHDLLRQLHILYPDHSGIADLLTEVTAKVPLDKPKPSWTPRPSLWTSQMNPALAPLALFGLFFLTFSVMTGWPALQAARLQGLGGTMVVHGKVVARTVSIASQLGWAGLLLALGVVCVAGACWVLLRRE